MGKLPYAVQQRIQFQSRSPPVRAAGPGKNLVVSCYLSVDDVMELSNKKLGTTVDMESMFDATSTRNAVASIISFMHKLTRITQRTLLLTSPQVDKKAVS